MNKEIYLMILAVAMTGLAAHLMMMIYGVVVESKHRQGSPWLAYIKQVLLVDQSRTLMNTSSRAAAESK